MVCMFWMICIDNHCVRYLCFIGLFWNNFSLVIKPLTILNFNRFNVSTLTSPGWRRINPINIMVQCARFYHHKCCIMRKTITRLFNTLILNLSTFCSTNNTKFAQLVNVSGDTFKRSINTISNLIIFKNRCSSSRW